MTVEVIESLWRSKHGPPQLGQDRLVAGDNFFVVIDGSTTESSESDSLGSTDLVDALVQAFKRLDPMVTADEAWSTLIEKSARAAAGRPISGSAVFAAYSVARHEIWQIGNCFASFGGESYVSPSHADTVAARARALFLTCLIVSGRSIPELRRADPGRKFIEPLLSEMTELRNRANSPFGFGVFDGSSDGRNFLQIWALPRRKGELILTTDGYFDVRGTLADSERGLFQRIARDPLLIEDPPATKGVGMDNESFDDRIYLRIKYAP